jgi:TPR repeat protein
MPDMIEHPAADAACLIAHGDPATAMLAFGMKYATGETGMADLVAAHKWFNLAAMRGCKEAARLRREIAAEMSPVEIAAAQRAARDWLATH